MMTHNLGVAVIGCGYWGVNYVRILNELPGVTVTAICEQRAERLGEIRQRFPETPVFSSLEQVLAMPEVEAVVICTGATTHFEIACQAIAAGKHLLIEKPLTTKPADAAELVKLAQRQGVKLMVGHTFLYNPAVHLVKEHVQQADLGEIYYLYSCRTNLGPIRHDVNALWDLAPHDVSIFNYLLDSTPRWVSAVGAKVLKNHREDVGFISLGYDNNIIGHIHVSWADPNKVRELVVVGSKQRIVFNDMNTMERVKIFEKGISPVQPEAASFGEFQYLMRDGDIISPHVAASEPLKNQCRHFVDCIVNDQHPQTDGQDGLAVVRVMTAIEQSIQQRGAPVFIDEPAVPMALNLNEKAASVAAPQSTLLNLAGSMERLYDFQS
jgi:predicted dehydrogenase